MAAGASVIQPLSAKSSCSSAAGDCAMVHRLIGVAGLVLLWAGFVNAQTASQDRRAVDEGCAGTAAEGGEHGGKRAAAGRTGCEEHGSRNQKAQELDTIAGVIKDELKKQEAILAKLDMLMQNSRSSWPAAGILDAIVHQDAAGRDVLQLSPDGAERRVSGGCAKSRASRPCRLTAK